MQQSEACEQPRMHLVSYIHNEADIELEVNEEDVGNDGDSLNADEISSINCESDCEVAETIQEEDVTIGEENDETIEDSQPDTEIVEAPKLDANCHKKSESEKLSKIVRKTVKENKKKQKSDVKISSTKDNEVNDKQINLKSQEEKMCRQKSFLCLKLETFGKIVGVIDFVWYSFVFTITTIILIVPDGPGGLRPLLILILSSFAIYASYELIVAIDTRNPHMMKSYRIFAVLMIVLSCALVATVIFVALYIFYYDESSDKMEKPFRFHKRENEEEFSESIDFVLLPIIAVFLLRLTIYIFINSLYLKLKEGCSIYHNPDSTECCTTV
ncbi:CLUMA_CG015813, isoform A [Clunio marinus]|uniref:CLUMA_CG015813, isoform A n=1 Tax=Clunio marinus TaxID=568069 RepID=A0A1J1IRP9_9DIPT|nr:CLUMA_CG015813, isoform A [Clunio marinus]